LAASIAHEINNPMASVTNLLYLLEHHGNLDDTAREYVRLAEEELGRVTHIVRQMLGFYREAESPVDVSLREVVENVLLLYKRRISNTGIHVQSRYDFDGVIHAFPGEIRQVFSNLIVNAVEAVGSTGCIRVHVSASRDWARPEARGVRVTIADNGPGIAPAARRKIFDPFFTTKGERGTGLGLWVSEGIVRKHGGFIRVHTSTGRYHGTSFSVFIPTQAPAQKRARTPRVA
jgi:signal transduction histidine kinase